MLDFDDDDLVQDHVAFIKKLRNAAEAIRADANGKTCGECIHCQDGWCDSQVNIEGSPLSILYPTAVACKAFRAKQA